MWISPLIAQPRLVETKKQQERELNEAFALLMKSAGYGGTLNLVPEAAEEESEEVSKPLAKYDDKDDAEPEIDPLDDNSGPVLPYSDKEAGTPKDKFEPIIYLVRHGKTALNSTADKDRIRGWRDVALDSEGEKEATKLKNFFSKNLLKNIYCSNLSRSETTANKINEDHDLELVVSQDFRPWNVGIHTGEESKKVHPLLAELVKTEPDKVIEKGESFNQFIKRYITRLAKLMSECEKGKNGPILICAHFRNIKATQAWLKNECKITKDKVPDLDTTTFLKNDLPTGVIYKMMFNKDKGWHGSLVTNDATDSEYKKASYEDPANDPFTGRCELEAQKEELSKKSLKQSALWSRNMGLKGIANHIADYLSEVGVSRMTGANRFLHGTSNPVAQKINVEGLQPSYGASGAASMHEGGNAMTDLMKSTSTGKIHVAPDTTAGSNAASRFASLTQRGYEAKKGGRPLTDTQKTLAQVRALLPLSRGSVVSGLLHNDQLGQFIVDPHMPNPVHGVKPEVTFRGKKAPAGLYSDQPIPPNQLGENAAEGYLQAFHPDIAADPASFTRGKNFLAGGLIQAGRGIKKIIGQPLRKKLLKQSNSKQGLVMIPALNSSLSGYLDYIVKQAVGARSRRLAKATLASGKLPFPEADYQQALKSMGSESDEVSRNDMLNMSTKDRPWFTAYPGFMQVKPRLNSYVEAQKQVPQHIGQPKQLARAISNSRAQPHQPGIGNISIPNYEAQKEIWPESTYTSPLAQATLHRHEQELLSGRHGNTRQALTREQMVDKLPSATGEQSSYHGYTGQGGQPSGMLPGTGLWVSGYPEVSSGYGSLHGNRYKPEDFRGSGYLAQLNTPSLRQVSTSGPFHPHLALDTRGYTPEQVNKVMTETGTSGRNQDWASRPQYEAVMTAPTNLLPHTQNLFKELPTGRWQQVKGASYHNAMAGVAFDGNRRMFICPHCDKQLTPSDIYTDAKGWTFCRDCFRKGKGAIKLPEKRSSDGTVNYGPKTPVNLPTSQGTVNTGPSLPSIQPQVAQPQNVPPQQFPLKDLIKWPSVGTPGYSPLKDIANKLKNSPGNITLHNEPDMQKGTTPYLIQQLWNSVNRPRVKQAYSGALGSGEGGGTIQPRLTDSSGMTPAGAENQPSSDTDSVKKK
jgi:broad specificity phosphatase PhoE